MRLYITESGDCVDCEPGRRPDCSDCWMTAVVALPAVIRSKNAEVGKLGVKGKKGLAPVGEE